MSGSHQTLPDRGARALRRGARPRSRAAHDEAARHLLGGVPMPWMAKWAGGFPVYLAEAHGARVVDIDGHEYADLCLGDTGAMAGHSPAPTVAAVRERLEERGGVTVMLPTEDAAWVGGELAAPLRPAAMAVHAHRHGREPLRAALLPPAHGPQQGARVRLVLPRLGRRDLRDPRGRAPARAARAGRRRGRPDGDDRGGRVQRPRRRSSRRSRAARSRACWPSRR